MTAQSFLVSSRPSFSERASSYATDSSEIEAGFGGSPTDVRQPWLCRLKPTRGCTRSRTRLQRAALRRLQPQRVAVDVDALRVAPLEPFGAVGVQHRDDVQGQRATGVRLHRGLVAVPLEVLEEVEQRRRGGRLVAVHLRPEQHAERPVPDSNVIDGAALDATRLTLST